MSFRLIQGDCVEKMRELEPESVQCVVTSPPYWGLRDYGTATWEGGDDPECDHTRAAGGVRNKGRNRAASGGTFHDSPEVEAALALPYRTVCGICGATRIDQQLGLESTPEQYVERMVEVFREVRRVLRDDGTVWLNLGDCYNSSPSNQMGKAGSGMNEGRPKYAEAGQSGNGERQIRAVPGLKPKDLVGIPWRVAFALQADGWWLRSDIIWAKPNPMPESVTDRPTKAHEYVFLLTKAKTYYYDADAVRETDSGPTGGRQRFAGTNRYAEGFKLAPEQANGNATLQTWQGVGRNLRSVWNIATEPYPEAHFATFPKALVTPCVKAGSASGDVVLDPFCGSGTVGVVALREGRSFIGIDLNPTYVEMARGRIHNDGPLFNQETNPSSRLEGVEREA
jgi:DNA modification methylase